MTPMLSPMAAFLLTPLREGRHTPDTGDYYISIISTHAPAGGATRADEQAVRIGHISTHAPAGGATRFPRWCRHSNKPYFYSRPCGRGDASPIVPPSSNG